MNGEIDKNGFLSIWRSFDRLVRQMCPFNTTDAVCGDWCPLFGEPTADDDGEVMLDICHDEYLYFKEFSDERAESNND